MKQSKGVMYNTINNVFNTRNKPKANTKTSNSFMKVEKELNSKNTIPRTSIDLMGMADSASNKQDAKASSQNSHSNSQGMYISLNYLLTLFVEQMLSSPNTNPT
jgi:hypothetical protein